MRAFLKDELERFLMAIDQALGQPVEVIVIGGTAAALHYGVTRATHDIDTWTTVKGDLAAAAETARLATGLDIPVTRSRRSTRTRPSTWTLSSDGSRMR